MKIYREKDYEGMSRRAAQIIASYITVKPDLTLGLATGSTPEGTYACLAQWYSQGHLDFSQVTTVNLDEYKGLPGSDPQSYRYFMDHHLFSKVNISAQRTFLPDGLAEDSEAECRRYDQVISDCGGQELQLLGLGPNGHIGFNEPDDVFSAGTHCVALTQSTIQANRRFFASEEDVPRYAFTMGIGTIMKARNILLVVNGKAKAEILHRALTGPVTPLVPASVLQLHNHVTVVADEDALSCF